MKELHRDQIVNNYEFPFSEALSFSILLWTVWGFVEAFYLQKLVPFILQAGEVPNRHLFLAAFFIYLTIAVVAAGILYWFVRWLLFTLGKQESHLVRGTTLALVLGSFFAAILNYSRHENFSHIASPSGLQYALFVFSALFAVFLTVAFFMRAARVGFHLSRSGTPIISILVLSLLLTFVRFPMFVGRPPSPARVESKKLDLKTSAKKLMAYYYLGLVIPLRD
jgi:hypothetical protein